MMKKFFFLTVLALISTLARAQYQLPNSGFDQFESDALHNSGIRPVNWNASNVLQFGYSMTVLTQEAGRTGQCACLENVTVIGQTSPAWITLGSPWADVESLTKINDASAGTDGGRAFTHRPDTMAVWIKRSGNGTENAFLIYYAWTGTSRGDSYMAKKGSCVPLTHYDEESDIRRAYDPNACGTAVQATQVAEGHWINNTAYSTWTEIKVPIEYLTNVAPEKINIILSAGNYPNQRSSNVHQGSKLWLDDLRLIYSSKAHEILLNNRKMNGFDPDSTFYRYALGEGVTTVPAITLKRSGRVLDASEYTINYGAVGDTTTITINAEDGSSQTTYKILFTQALSTNSRLADITVNGTSVEGFNPMVYSYNIALPFGTTGYPTIGYTLSESTQTATVSTPATFPGTATVTCTAADPAYSTTYSLNFSVDVLTDNTLTDIKVNGKTITGFSPTKNNYVVELPMGTTEDPVITYTTAYPDDHVIVVDNQGLAGGATISVTPRGTTNTRIYRLTFRVTASSYAYLQNIYLDGESIPGFQPETLTYYDTLAIGTTVQPTVTWTPGDEFQTITLENGGIDGVTKITVTSQSGNSNVYRIHFHTLKSSNSRLANIYLNGEPMQGFDPEQNSYSIALPLGQTTVPQITWQPGDEYQQISFSDGGLGGVSRIIVRAGDGSLYTYSITFTTSQSSVSTLQGIMIDGEMIEAFRSDSTFYSIVLPRGTNALPEITWTAGDAYQTIRKAEGGVNGDTRITVKAQDGTTTIYVIRFSVVTSSVTTLSDITIGGVSLPDFDPETLSYTYTLPGGTTTLPAISYVKGDESQTVAVSRGGINGETTISVRAEDGSSRVYRISFTVEKSANALLQMIYADSAAIAGFQPTTLDYELTIPMNATACPNITVEKNDGQQVTITVPAIVGTVRITVTPETGASNVYTINIHYPQSSNTDLAAISVDGQPLAGFSANVHDYSITVEGNQLPEVTAQNGDDAQISYVHTDPAAMMTEIFVQAESGDTAVYRIRYNRTESSVATLSDLKIDGVTIADFSSSVLDYTVMLDRDAASAPVLTYTKTDAASTAVMTMPALDGTASITVTSEDKSATTTYTVNFQLTPSTVSTLSAVYQNGVAIPMSMFINDTATISLPYGAQIPAITYKRGDARQMVYMATSGAQGTDILVKAESGAMSRYVVRFSIAKNSNSKLSDLNILGFNPNTLTYNIALPWRTRVQPQLQPVPGDKGQSIRVNYGGINGATTIVVTAEDGVTETTYTINYTVKASSVAYLENIYYNGTPVPSFDRDRLTYTISLPYGTKSTPKLTWDLAMAPDGSELIEQRVEYSERPIGQTSMLKVTAEDGSTQTYSVLFKVKESEAENVLNMIAFGANAIANYEPTRYNYEVGFPSGTTALPAISYQKSFPEQTVEILSDGLQGTTTIKVYSNRAEQEVTTYTIVTDVMTISDATLTAILVDGTPITRFNPGQTSYVVPVTAQPEITFTAADGASASIVEEDSKHAVISVTKGASEEFYTLYYYYSNDIIPNANFTDWEMATYKGSKPTSWMVPGDATDCFTWTFLKTCPGSEAAAYGGNGGIILATVRDGDANAIYGSIPGIATLGRLTMSLGSSGNSSSSVSGSIQFRNTPEALMVDYNPIEASNVPNWRMWINMGDGSNTVQSLYEGSFDNNTWQTAMLPINYSGLGTIQNMNITLNACHKDNAGDLGGITKRTSKVVFRNLHFLYNNTLASVAVDGEPLQGFAPETTAYSIALPEGYQGHPVLSTTGQTADQEHQTTWSAWSNNSITAMVRCIGEDGVQFTDYTFTFTRPQSSNANLQNIIINGVPVTGFAAGTYNYNVVLPATATAVPDIQIVKGTSVQTTNITLNGNTYTISVTAEDGTSATYTVAFSRPGGSDSHLAALSAEGMTPAFSANVTDYTVEIAEHDAQPLVEFQRAHDDQEAVLSDTAVTVTAADGSKTIYRIHVNRTVTPQATAFSAITVDDEPVAGYSASEHQYTYNTDADFVDYSFAGVGEHDAVMTYSTPNDILFSINGNAYTVALQRTLSANDDLAAIRRDGAILPSFDAAIYDYTTPVAREQYPEFVATASDAKAVLRVADADNGFDIIAEAQSGATHTTQVRYTALKDSDNTLSAIYLNGQMLERTADAYSSSSAFKSVINDYDIIIKSDNPKMQQPAMPEITAVAKSAGAVVSIAQGGINASTEITVTSEAGTENIYTLDFSVEQSRNALLSDLAVNYHSVPGFNPNTTSYTYPLSSANEQPVVTYTTGDAFQTVEVNYFTGSAEVEVTSESGATKTYSVSFPVSKSSDAYIDNLLTDGEPVPGFSRTNLNYVVDLPIGTTVAPTVTVVAGDDGQQITVNEGGLDAPTSIVVTAEDGSTTHFYTLTFRVERSAVDTLAMIYIDGAPLEGFRGTQHNYTVSLPLGTETMPLVTYDLGDQYQSARQSADEENFIVSVNVTADNGALTTYLISFVRQMSHNALLQHIFVDGDSLDLFAPDKYNYVVDLPVGTTRVPDLSWVEGDQYQTVVYEPATDVNGYASIRVIAGDGVIERTYTVRFNRLLSSNAQLTSITINGMPIDGFQPDVYNYTDTLPVGTTALPLIEFVPGDAYQTFDTIDNGAGSRYLIIVHAEDMSTTIYTIDFPVAKSANAHLAAIEANGALLPGFDSEVLTYNIVLPYGQSALPALSYEPAEPGRQMVVVTFAKSVADTTYFTVTAEDGVSTLTYAVTYSQALCSIAELTAIRLDGEMLSTNARAFVCDNDFDTELYSYNIVLPYGTTELPEITWETATPDYHSVDLTQGDVHSQSVIRIVSEDEMTINEYELNFSVQPSSNSRLADLQLADGMLKGFDSETFDYEVVYPQGTDTASLPKPEDVVYVKMEDAQSVSVYQSYPTEMVVSVTAEDGKTVTVYHITFRIYQSSDCLLKDILINGKSVRDFEPEHFDYSYYIYQGNELPEVTPVLRDSMTQTVDVTLGNANEYTYIYVMAEDGTEATYTVLIEDSPVNTAEQPWEAEVDFLPLGGGDFRATSVREGVIITITAMDGRSIYTSMVDLIDPNDNIRDEYHGGGTIIHLDKNNVYYVYTFLYQGNVLKAGKFLW